LDHTLRNTYGRTLIECLEGVAGTVNNNVDAGTRRESDSTLRTTMTTVSHFTGVGVGGIVVTLLVLGLGLLLTALDWAL
jgi:hypothetical protein